MISSKVLNVLITSYDWRLCSGSDLIYKWRPFYYSIMFMPISPPSLASVCKIQKNFCSKIKLGRLISMHRKKIINWLWNGRWKRWNNLVPTSPAFSAFKMAGVETAGQGCPNIRWTAVYFVTWHTMKWRFWNYFQRLAAVFCCNLKSFFQQTKTFRHVWRDKTVQDVWSQFWQPCLSRGVSSSAILNAEKGVGTRLAVKNDFR